MEIQRNRVGNSSLKDDVDGVEKQPYNYRERKIQSMVDAHLFYDGEVSGRHYEWLKSGDILLVDERDVPSLLSKRIGTRLCCGSHPNEGNLVFQESQ